MLISDCKTPLSQFVYGAFVSPLVVNLCLYSSEIFGSWPHKIYAFVIWFLSGVLS